MPPALSYSALQTVMFFVMGCEPGQGGAVGSGPWMPSASGVHRGRLKIEQQMLFSKSPFDSCPKQLHMDFFFYFL